MMMLDPFGGWIYRGPREKRSIALTFDDGPSGSTSRLLEVLAHHDAHATFFQCGMHARRHKDIARATAEAGHEIGNHTDSHRLLALRSRRSLHDELRRAQESIAEATGQTPVLFRPPYGVRWFGLRGVLRELGLLGVMWTKIGRDWKCPADQVLRCLRRGVANGAILCLHDGRDVEAEPDIENTIEAVRRLLPELKDQGFRFETVSRLIAS
jgi:peptidoglycan/xylan/chitin deacetylase (PgdA/CDA1 family)